MAEITKILFCTFIFEFLFNQIAANRNMGKYVCHLATLKKYLIANKYLTTVLIKIRVRNIYIIKDEYFHVLCAYSDVQSLGL